MIITIHFIRYIEQKRKLKIKSANETSLKFSKTANGNEESMIIVNNFR
jgi:hypothetical protein